MRYQNFSLAGKRSGIVGLLVVALWLVLGSQLGSAQVTAAITGRIVDSSGAAIPGATITVTNLETAASRTATADDAGAYQALQLPVGRYEIRAERSGFRAVVRTGVTIAVGQQAVVNMTLEVGNIEQQVTVSAEAPIVNTTLASTSGLVNQEQIKDMPLNGRSFDQLLTLTTGTVNYTSNNNNLGNFFSVVGHRPEENEFTINGIEYIGSNSAGQPSPPYGSSGQTLGVDAVREFNLVQHSYGSEYGKRAGGHISIVTTGGTNQLHGSVFEYLRNNVLDARNFFDTAHAPDPTPVAPFKRNQFGGALGGPIKRDKLFLFGSYEGFRERLALSSDAIVPDAQARQGLLPCNQVGVSAANCPASGYAPVPNLAAGMLPYANTFWPTPNGPELLVNGLPSGTAHAISNPAQAIREDFGMTRFDYIASDKDSLSVNYIIDDGIRIEPRTNPVFTRTSQAINQLLAVQETHIFSPTVLNVFNAGFTRSFAPNTTPPTVSGSIPENLSFVSGRLPGQITIGGGVSTAAASGITAAQGNDPTYNAVNLFTVSDDVHFTRGRHSISVGGWFQRVQDNQNGPNQNKTGTAAYPSLLAFLQDNPSQFNVNLVVTGLGWRQIETAWYVQDEFKAKDNLTISLGLRTESTNGWNEILGRCSNLLFDEHSIPLTEPLISHNCLTENHAKALFQPRVGLAWDVTGTGSWAIRAGFGIHKDLQDNQSFRLDGNPPFNPRIVLNGPMLSLTPLDASKPLPPTCNAALVAAKAECATYSVGGVQPDFYTPTVQQWSFAIEHALARDLAIQLSYVGSQSYHTIVPVNMNAPYPLVCNDPAGCRSGGVGRTPATVPQGTTYIPAIGTNGRCPGSRGNAVACYPNPYQNKSNSQMFEGTMNYNSFNVSLVKRASHGLTFKTNYTWAKGMDYNSGLSSNASTNQPKAILNKYDLSLSRGIAAFSMKHQFNTNFAYELPFGKGQAFAGNSSGLVNALIGGWQWNGIINAQGGFPFTPLVGANVSGTGDTDNPDVPNYNPAFTGKKIIGKVDQWFDPNAFTVPLSGTFGNVARGAYVGPRLVNIDTSFFKGIPINERFNMQFRAEFFNLFNHANFASPNPVVFSGTSISSSAGVITSTSTTSRQIQFALKLTF